MPKFSIKELFVATTIFAVGLAIAVYVLKWHDRPNLLRNDFLLFFGGCVIAALGSVYPFRKFPFVVGVALFSVVFFSLALVLICIG